MQKLKHMDSASCDSGISCGRLGRYDKSTVTSSVTGLLSYRPLSMIDLSAIHQPFIGNNIKTPF